MIYSKGLPHGCQACGKDTYKIVCIQTAAFQPSVRLCRECAMTVKEAIEDEFPTKKRK